MNEHSAKFLRQRQFMTVIPVMVYPFVALFFWALGGGQGVKAQIAQRPATGINTTIPQANNVQRNRGRLSLYEQADQDSARLKELQLIEARRLGLDTFDRREDFYQGPDGAQQSYTNSGPVDANERKVSDKLSQLQKRLDEASQTSTGNLPATPGLTMGGANDESLNNIRLMMQQAGGDQAPDTELATINQMLHTLRDIQTHGSEVAKVKQQSAIDRTRVFTIAPQLQKEDVIQRFGKSRAVDTVAGSADSTRIIIPTLSKRVGFYSLEDGQQQEGSNTVAAIVYKTATVVSNATLQLMLTDDIILAGRLIPKGTFVYGVVKINNERVMVDIETIQYERSLFPVSMTCYGLDGQAGIPAPGAVTQDATSAGVDNAMQMMTLGSIDPSVGAQAASAGIQTAKNLLSRKIKTIKATVHAGDAVLLVDNKSKQ